MYSTKLDIDKIFVEYPIGNYSVDVLIHCKDGTWYVVEIEEKLTDAAIGQVIKYKVLLYKLRKIFAKPLTVCKEADPKLVQALRLDVGIDVIVIN